MKPIFYSVLLALACLSAAKASVIVRFIEAGGNVEVSIEGRFNLTGWTYVQDNAVTTDLIHFRSDLGYAFGTVGTNEWEYEIWHNPAGTVSISGLTSFTGSPSGIAPIIGQGGVGGAGDRFIFNGSEDGIPDTYDPSLFETVVWAGSLLDLLGDDDFEITYTYPDPDGVGLGFSESVTFTTAVPEPSAPLFLLPCVGLVAFWRCRVPNE